VKSSKDRFSNNTKIFVDAAFGATVGQFLLLIIYLIIFSGIYRPLIDFLSKNTSSTVFDISNRTEILLLVLGILPLLVFLMVNVLRIKYGIYRNITTDDRGLTFRGLIKETHIPWNKVASINIHDSFLLRLGITIGKIKMGEINVNSNKYFFPLSMKEEGQEYPALYRLFLLIDENSNKIKEILPKDCQLYVEIQKHVKS
jgi:hypothetical protein